MGVTAPAPSLRFRPRLAAWLYIVPAGVFGLMLASCGVVFALPSEQAGTPAQPQFLSFTVLGFAMLAAPVLNYINSEVLLRDGMVSKRGLLRVTRRWPADEIVGVNLRVKDPSQDAPARPYAAYRFVRRDNAVAFELNQRWWRPSDIHALITALGLPVPATATRSYL